MFKFQEISSEPAGSVVMYAVALRAIGQDLTGLPIEYMEITLQDDVFVVRGHCIAQAETRNGSQTWAKFHAARRTLATTNGNTGNGKESSRRLFDLEYTAEDIHELDELGAQKKGGAKKTPDASSLAESLRSVGRVLDEKGGRLIKLSKDPRKIALEYESAYGKMEKEEHYSLSHYKNQQRGLSKRGTGKREDVWRYSS